MLWVIPGQEARFLAPLPVRKIPGVGKVMETSLHDLGISTVGDLSRFEPTLLEERFGKWGLTLAGKAQGSDASGWYDETIGVTTGPKSISHEHTFIEDTANADQLESMLARLSEMVGRRLRENGLYTCTMQLKLRYADFSTITRAHSLNHPTQLDPNILKEVLTLFRRHWKKGAAVRLLGVQASSLDRAEPQLDLFHSRGNQKWQQALSATDRLRDKYGDTVVSLTSALKSSFRERTHENPVSLPGKTKKPPTK